MSTPEDDAGDLGEQLHQECRDQAAAILELYAATDPRFAVRLEHYRPMIQCGVEAGIAGALAAVKERGL